MYRTSIFNPEDKLSELRKEREEDLKTANELKIVKNTEPSKTTPEKLIPKRI